MIIVFSSVNYDLTVSLNNREALLRNSDKCQGLDIMQMN